MKSTFFLRSSRGIHLAETKPPTGFCKNRLSGPPKSRKQRKQRFGAPRRAENSENCVSGNPEERKTEKTANSVGRIVRNRQKLQIPWAESSEIGENCKFCGQNHQKTAKTANSVDRIVRNRRKPPFPTLGKAKSPKNSISQP